MSVLVNGMEMPKNCNSCPMCLMRFCQAGDRELSEQETRPNAKRPEDCPLIHVLEHGRLIDADKLNEEVCLLIKENMLSRDDARDLLETIADAPTVIPAEEGE